MTKKDFENRIFSNSDIVNSIFHFVKTYLDGWEHRVLCIKVKRIDKKSMDTIVLSELTHDKASFETPYITLWSIPFSFSEMSEEDNYVIQNCAHIITQECCEMSKRREFIEKDHMTSEQANEACKKLFIHEKTFEYYDRKKNSQKNKYR